MIKINQIEYVCPATGDPLNLEVQQEDQGRVKEGVLRSQEGVQYFIRDGVPDFTWPPQLDRSDAETLSSYESIAQDYDMYASLPFITYRSDEYAVREHMADLLALTPESRVLEIGCGTGRGALHLVKRLGKQGALYLQELSPGLLAQARRKLESNGVDAEFSIANGSYLPFEDNFFDAAHHFGGINTFSDIRRCLSELVRVVKPGGKIVIGDEGLAPWLKEAEFGRIMTNSNPLLKCSPPLELLPANVDEVRLEYIMMGAFYSVDFKVLNEPHQPDYHMRIPSKRGGTHWTRYHGQLEGVSDETKRLALLARDEAGLSMHDWLDKVVSDAAKKQLDKKN